MNRPDAIGTRLADHPGAPTGHTTSLHAPDDRVLVEEWAEEFLERRRRGERPTVEEYVSAHPDRAEEIRELFAAVVLIEDLKPRSDDESARIGGFTLLRGDQPIERLGDYRLLREVGRGGMGVVYEAEQESLGRRVALKVLAPWSSPSTQQVQRFHREARAAAQLHHTNIVPVFGVGESEGLHYYAMQYIQGLGLDAVIEEVRRLQGHPPVDDSVAESQAPVTPGLKAASATEVARSLVQGSFGGHADAEQAAARAGGPREHPRLAVGMPGSTELTVVSDSARLYARSVARIGLQVAEALAYAHEQGTLHRDIKPSNLLLDGHGIVWVSDFGLAKVADDVDLTRTGDLVGTIRYMAPERFQGDCDARADVYALGLTLYELLACRPAFEESDRHSLIHRISHSEPARLRKVNPMVPRDLETIVHKAIEKQPGARYASSRLLAEDLRRYLEGRPIRARRTNLAERSVRWARRNPGHAALGATVLVLLVAIALISSVAAIWLGHKHKSAMKFLHEAEAARAEARRQLWDSYLAQARASRLSDRAGRRFDALDVLGAAARMELNTHRVEELRNEAIACLALADLRELTILDDPKLASERSFAAVSDDASRIALGGHEGTVHVLDRANGRELTRFPGFGDLVGTLKFSPDGTKLAVKHDEGGRLTLWDLGQPGSEPILNLPQGVQGDAYDFSPDSALLAVASPAGTIELLDTATGAHVRGWPARPAPDMLKFDRQGGRLAASRILPQAAITIHDVESGDTLVQLPSPQVDRGMSWSPDGSRLAVGCDDKRIRIFDLGVAAVAPQVLEGHQGQVISVDYHPSGDLLASASWDGSVHLWDPHDGTRLLSTPSPAAWHIRFTSDGRYLTHGRNGSRYFLWEVATGEEARVLHGSRGEELRSWSGAFHPNGHLFASTTGSAIRIDQVGVGEVAAIAMPNAQGVDFLPDGSAMLTSGDPGLLRWPIRKDHQRGTIQIGPPTPIGPATGHPIRRFALSRDGRTMAVLYPSVSGRLVAFPIDQPEKAVTMTNHPGAERVAISPDGRWAATGTWKGHDVRVWDLRDGSLAATLAVPGSADVAFSPDGRQLVTGSGQAYQFWEVGTWQPSMIRMDRKDSGDLPGKLGFTRDGSILAVSRSRSQVALLDPATGREFAALESPSMELVASLEFDPRGERLAVTHNHEGIRFWDLAMTRSALRGMGLDWEPPGNSTTSPGASSQPRLRVEVLQPAWMDRQREAEQLVVAGDLATASDVYEKAIEAGARDFETRYRAAILRLARNDTEGYRRFCQALHDEYGSLDDIRVIGWLTWTAVLGPDAVDDPESLVRRATWLAQADDRAYTWNTLGAALVRAGRPSEAISALERAMVLDGEGSSLDLLFLALAYDALAQPERARRCQKQAEGLLRRELDQLQTHQASTRAAFVKLEHDIVLREVEQQLARLPE